MSDLVLNDEISAGFTPIYKAVYVPKVTVNKNALGVVIDTIRHGPDHDWLVATINFRDLTTAQRGELFDFVRSVGGQYDTFLLKDEFGIGCDVTEYSVHVGGWQNQDTFQLVDARGTATYNRKNIVSGSEVIKYGSTTKVKNTDYSIDYTDSGIVTYIIDPTLYQAVYASYQYYRRMRFSYNAVFGTSMSLYDLSDAVLVMEEEAVS